MTHDKQLLNNQRLTNLLLLTLLAAFMVFAWATPALHKRHDKCLEVYLSAQVGGQPALVKQIICENLKEKTNV